MLGNPYSYGSDHWCGLPECAYCNPPAGMEHVVLEPAPVMQVYGQPEVPKPFRLATRPDALTRTGIDLPPHDGHTFCMTHFQATDERPGPVEYIDPDDDR